MNKAGRSHAETTLLAIDDDPSILRVMGLRLGSKGYRVLSAADGRKALALSRESTVDLAVIDHKLDGEDGVELMEKLRQHHPDLPVIILTAYGTIGNAVDAMQRGACTYLTKPFDGEKLVEQVEGCLEKQRPEPAVPDQTVPDAPAELSSAAFDPLIAKSRVMKAVLAQVAQVAGSDANVYIQGESGTGKEMVARSLHAASPRRDGPFVAVNCAAIPESLLESELFGHVKGAFTSADRHREGLFAQAQGGSFFLDEISELPMSMQVKLLRVLEEREFYPLGSSHKVKMDVRFISASNRDLEQWVNQGRFREDLYYRIHVIPVSLPPLRKRKADILPLAKSFLTTFSQASGKSVRELSHAAVDKLLANDWPGNVRELKNVMEYAVAMATGAVVTPELITGAMTRKDAEPPSLSHAKDKFERDYLIELLELNHGNVSQAAKMAGKYRADLYGLLRKHGLNPMDFRQRKTPTRGS